MEKQDRVQEKTTNRDLLIPYAAPYFVYVGIASIGGRFLPDDIRYMMEIILVPLLLYWAWKWYVPVTGPKAKSGSVLWGIAAGLFGLPLWCLLLAPFIDVSGEPWPMRAFVLRGAAATLIVPVFEEMFIRGYMLRAALQWDNNRKSSKVKYPLSKTLDKDDIGTVGPGEWSVTAVLISSIAFTIGHLMAEWPAAMAYSILMSVLWIWRKDLLSCMAAHATTNLGLAVYVYYSGNWGFW